MGIEWDSMVSYNSNGSKGETLDWGNVELPIAVSRVVARAIEGVNARYRALLEAEPVYQIFLDSVTRAEATAEKFRQLARAFHEKAEDYRRRLDEGRTGDSETDYTTEVDAALANFGFFENLALAEVKKRDEASANAIPYESGAWRQAFNEVASQLGRNTWKQVSEEAAITEGKIMDDVRQRLDGIVEERKERESQAVIQSHKAHLEGARSSAENSLRELFGDVYAGEPVVTHVDGNLGYATGVTIYTDDPQGVASRLPGELQTAEGVLTLDSGKLDSIPLNDGNGTFILEATYRGSKKLH